MVGGTTPTEIPLKRNTPRVGKQVSTPPSPPDNTSSLTPATVAAKRAYMRLLSLGSLSEPLQDAAVWPAEAEGAAVNIEVGGW